MSSRREQDHFIRCFSLLFLFLLSFFSSRSQEQSCDFLMSYAKTNTRQAIKKYIVNTINRNPNQQDCFFENSVNLLKNNTNRDTIENIFNVWFAISKDECGPKLCYLNSLRETKAFKSEHCSILKSIYQKCPKDNIDHDYLFKAINCPSYTCEEIDSIFKTRTDTFDLNETKAITNLLAQRNCHTSRTYLKYNEEIITKEPTFNSLYNQAKIYQELNQKRDAYTFFAKAEKIARLPEQRAICYLGIARLLEKQNEYSKAKDFAQLASENDPINQESFVFLAQLFSKSEQICQPLSDYERCGLYLLIAQLYHKAGAKNERDKYLSKSGIEKILQEAKVKTVRLNCFINQEIELKK